MAKSCGIIVKTINMITGPRIRKMAKIKNYLKLVGAT